MKEELKKLIESKLDAKEKITAFSVGIKFNNDSQEVSIKITYASTLDKDIYVVKDTFKYNSNKDFNGITEKICKYI